jgi:hypothetical protein
VIEVHRVLPEWAPRTWPLVAVFIDAALQHATDGTTEDDARIHVFSGRWQLFVAVEEGKIRGAAVVDIFNRGKDRVAFIVAIGGRLITSKDTFAQLKAQLVLLGATELEGAARESVARLWTRYGLTEKHRIVGVSLWAEAAPQHNQHR